MAGAKLVKRIHDDFLRGDVEPGRRLVGDQQFRLGRERHGNENALTHAAGKFVRKRAEAILCPVDAHLIKKLQCAPRAVPAT